MPPLKFSLSFSVWADIFYFAYKIQSKGRFLWEPSLVLQPAIGTCYLAPRPHAYFHLSTNRIVV